MTTQRIVTQMAKERARRPRITVVTVACIVVLVIAGVCAAIGPMITPLDPTAQDIVLGATAPSAAHLLGTDDLGRDVLSRLIAGSQTAIIGAVAVAIGATLLGTVVGLIAGFRGGALDGFLMRITDLVWAFPSLLTTLVVVGVFSGGYWVAVAMFILFGWPIEARIVRSVTLVQRTLPYVEAARTLDVSEPVIAFRHVLPNVLPTVVANLLLGFVGALVGLSGLSFLGLGVPPGVPDWGLMINENRSILELNIWGSLAPSIALILVGLAATLAADRWYGKVSKDGGAR
ncbi:ABC transporter permease [Microbacterium sp. EST19A]|uniref:ABC transporter permease n=1 Tax=Microbacterium sp. EST19A TaxID=2862681 RepID=UPI001CBAE3A4|nr:ABC transporter permease [Microbacterium sp. EST19A]